MGQIINPPPTLVDELGNRRTAFRHKFISEVSNQQFKFVNDELVLKLETQLNKSLMFDGVDSFVQSPFTLAATLNDYTISGWIKIITPPPAGANYTVTSVDGGSSSFVGLLIDQNRFLNDNLTGLKSSGVVPLNIWTYVSQVRAAGNVSFYFNAVFSGSHGNSLPGNIGWNWRVGSVYGNSHFFNGLMDDVRLYNHARTIAQLQGDMLSELTSPEMGLLFNCRFNDDINLSGNQPINEIVNGTANTFNFTGNPFINDIH
ncbi:MAG: hypothetical protein A3G34_15170 [Candidatus Lindowbacteria bacterium RIFCSPLOWO2_12_FULL_62_27]|nr:MAG: hypothetical protein A3G34_15170 [Candidatus Lindowbacteria bacterium RIFCSPLOWO2_12_FULL_62_27]OGH63865.1 MAG: hypothetical protein A3I06_06150 [Candidatus Lindowbacteria bacterium RIFCSPLOWO2_02_FULL_62_12]